MFRLLTAILLAWAVPLAAQETALDLDPARTHIEFSVDTTLHKIHGSFQMKRGSIRLDPGAGKASGDIVVDVTSGDTGGGARDRRMHKHILESDRYPEAVFTADRLDGSLKADGESQVDLHGRLQIHGESHEITLHTLARMKGDEITATSHLTIPYVRWGMKNPSSLVLRVADHVEIDVRLTALLVLHGLP